MKKAELLTGIADRLKAYVPIGWFTVLIVMIFHVSEAAQETAHFPAPVITNTFCEFKGNLRINGVEAEPGDEVAFFDSEDVLCGHSVVFEGFAGRYLFAYVYGD
ncbi:MAG: hypothetical protein GY869_08340, partial [Planctomycetes bacterium]|nr:hypothetical protein [Planctomycetota bacterium]